MANYEYRCELCSSTQIISRPMAEAEGIYSCDKCSGKLARVYTPAPVKFNASGFYSTGG